MVVGEGDTFFFIHNLIALSLSLSARGPSVRMQKRWNFSDRLDNWSSSTPTMRLGC